MSQTPFELFGKLNTNVIGRQQEPTFGNYGRPQHIDNFGYFGKLDANPALGPSGSATLEGLLDVDSPFPDTAQDGDGLFFNVASQQWEVNQKSITVRVATYQDPNREIGEYMALLGKTRTIDSYLEYLSGANPDVIRSKGDWKAEVGEPLKIDNVKLGTGDLVLIKNSERINLVGNTFTNGTSNPYGSPYTRIHGIYIVLSNGIDTPLRPLDFVNVPMQDRVYLERVYLREDGANINQSGSVRVFVDEGFINSKKYFYNRYRAEVYKYYRNVIRSVSGYDGKSYDRFHDLEDGEDIGGIFSNEIQKKADTRILAHSLNIIGETGDNIIAGLAIKNDSAYEPLLVYNLYSYNFDLDRSLVNDNPTVFDNNTKSIDTTFMGIGDSTYYVFTATGALNEDNSILEIRNNVAEDDPPLQTEKDTKIRLINNSRLMGDPLFSAHVFLGSQNYSLRNFLKLTLTGPTLDIPSALINNQHNIEFAFDPFTGDKTVIISRLPAVIYVFIVTKYDNNWSPSDTRFKEVELKDLGFQGGSKTQLFIREINYNEETLPYTMNTSFIEDSGNFHNKIGLYFSYLETALREDRPNYYSLTTKGFVFDGPERLNIPKIKDSFTSELFGVSGRLEEVCRLQWSDTIHMPYNYICLNLFQTNIFYKAISTGNLTPDSLYEDQAFIEGELNSNIVTIEESGNDTGKIPFLEALNLNQFEQSYLARRFALEIIFIPKLGDNENINVTQKVVYRSFNKKEDLINTSGIDIQNYLNNVATDPYNLPPYRTVDPVAGEITSVPILGATIEEIKNYTKYKNRLANALVNEEEIYSIRIPENIKSIMSRTTGDLIIKGAVVANESYVEDLMNYWIIESGSTGNASDGVNITDWSGPNTGVIVNDAYLAHEPAKNSIRPFNALPIFNYADNENFKTPP